MGSVQLNVGTVKKIKSRNPIIEFDKLQLYFKKPYIINAPDENHQIIIQQPRIGDIVEFGQGRYYSTINIFTTNTTASRLQLWKKGIDWNDISDFDLFIRIFNAAEKSIYQKILFNKIEKPLDFSTYGMYEKKSKDGKTEKVLYSKDDEVEINENVYFHLSQYFRNVFNIFPDEKITHDSTMKKWFIRKDKNELTNKQLKGNDAEKDNGFMSLISACCNHPGFKYKPSELEEIGVYEFYDSVKRLQVYESCTALQKGMYSGMIDGSKINPEDYNFMKNI